MPIDGPGNGITTPNTLPINPLAKIIMCLYPLQSIRRDMSMIEYNQYKQNWFYFNQVWEYNWTVSTLNAALPLSSARYAPWQHLSMNDLLSYSNGQLAHIQVYSNAPPGQFNNIG